ncbi:hypothetical protein MXB_5650, partial [Myxobolus squamalis]
MSVIEIDGAGHFRHALALSILSKIPIKIKNIRINDEKFGIFEYETNLLQLVDNLMDGSVIQISADGLSLYFKPGSFAGGVVKHKCSIHRPIGYYLEFVTWISLSLKNKLSLTLEGITNCSGDPSVDAIRISSLNLMRNIGFDIETKIDIVRRGYGPLGGGACVFTCIPPRTVSPINITDIGSFTNVKGTSYSMRVSPQIGDRLVEYANNHLSNITHHISIKTDHRKSFGGGLSPGYGLVLSAETNTGVIITSEAGTQTNHLIGTDPESISISACHSLFQEIYS